MTGFRLARGGYQERCGDRPRSEHALGKVIGGGLPVGGVWRAARKSWTAFSPDGPVYKAGTLSGNPLAMAAGLAQLRELERLDGWARLEEIGAAFRGRYACRCSTGGEGFILPAHRQHVLPLLRARPDLGPRRRPTLGSRGVQCFFPPLDSSAAQISPPTQPFGKPAFLSLASHRDRRRSRRDGPEVVASLSTLSAGKDHSRVRCPLVLLAIGWRAFPGLRLAQPLSSSRVKFVRALSPVCVLRPRRLSSDEPCFWPRLPEKF
jgi:hypothetical protein